jgi:hypothetical protein
MTYTANSFRTFTAVAFASVVSVVLLAGTVAAPMVA